MNNLTDDQQKRYRRQLILKEVGETGQKKLMNSKVLIVGAGGLGSPILYYLVAAGVGRVGIADHDVIDLSNLQRQILHSTHSIGVEKTVSAKEKLNALNPDVNIDTYNFHINANNVGHIVDKYELVINAVDNVETRYVLNKICMIKGIPLIEGAINNFDGHVMTIIPGKSACYQCVFPEPPEGKKGEIGVIGTIPGIIGSIQATEAIKYLLNVGRSMHNSIIYYDALNVRFREIQVQKDPYCPVCMINYYANNTYN